jgi:hypothetical protein
VRAETVELALLEAAANGYALDAGQASVSSLLCKAAAIGHMWGLIRSG